MTVDPSVSRMDLVAARRSRQRQDAIKASIKQVQRMSDSPYVQTLFSKVVEPTFTINDDSSADDVNLPSAHASPSLMGKAGPLHLSSDVRELPPRPPTRQQANSAAASVRSSPLIPVGALLFAPANLLKRAASPGDDPHEQDGTSPRQTVDCRARPPSALLKYRDKIVDISKVKFPLVADRGLNPCYVLTGDSSAPNAIVPLDASRPPSRQRSQSVVGAASVSRPATPSHHTSAAATQILTEIPLLRRPHSAMTVYSHDGTVREALETESEVVALTSPRSQQLRDQLREMTSSSQRGMDYFMKMARSQVAAESSVHGGDAAVAKVFHPHLLMPRGQGITKPAAISTPKAQPLQRPPTAQTAHARERTAVLRVKLFRRKAVQEEHAGSTPVSDAQSSAKGLMSIDSSGDIAHSRRGVVRPRFNHTL